jgi:hypothetical protein
MRSQGSRRKQKPELCVKPRFVSGARVGKKSASLVLAFLLAFAALATGLHRNFGVMFLA